MSGKQDLSRFLPKEGEAVKRRGPLVPPPSIEVVAKARKMQPDRGLDAPASLPRGSRTGMPRVPESEEEGSEQRLNFDQRIRTLAQSNTTLTRMVFDLKDQLKALVEEGVPITEADIVEIQETHDPEGGGLIKMDNIRGAPIVQATVTDISPRIKEFVFAVIEATAQELREEQKEMERRQTKKLIVAVANLLNRKIAEMARQKQKEAEERRKAEEEKDE